MACLYVAVLVTFWLSALPTTTAADFQRSNLTCVRCDRVASLSECTGSIQCIVDEECYMDELITEQLTVVYEGGCRAKDVCATGYGKRSGILSLHKRTELVACSRCCAISAMTLGHDCNTKLCGIKNACPLIDKCTHCSGSNGQNCDKCATGFRPVKDNSTCMNILHNYDVTCMPGVKDHCYIIFKSFLSWSDAKGVCEKRNGQLFVPQNVGEEMFVENYLTALQDVMYYSHSVFWIGGRIDSGNENWLYPNGGVDRHVSSHNLPMNSTSCLAMDGQSKFMWNNFRCDRPSFFICKETTPYHPSQQQHLIG